MYSALEALLSQGMRVAMEYSPMNAIPTMSYVDGGMLELVRSYGVEVISSANLAQRFVAQLTAEQMESHREAGRRLIAVKDTLFMMLGEDLRAGNSLNEYSVQQRLKSLMEQAGIVRPEAHVAVNANASNPHYEPTSSNTSPISHGDLVLFDFWGRLPGANSIFADYTWMAFAGTRDEIPTHQREVFEVVRRARDAGIAFARKHVAARERVEARQVDDVTRKVIADAGYGEYFLHRTGHSIGTVLQANGANIDDFETQDERMLLPSTCCSIEPGIYLPEFGIRSEVDILVHEHDVEVTGGQVQEEIVALLHIQPS
jgi:Xaa-Pro aminopeptidase